MKSILIISVICFGLSGCSSIMKSGSPISEDYGKRTAGALLDDQSIENRSHANIANAAPELRKAHIVVVSFNGVVLLAGQVASNELRNLAETTVKNIRKVRLVHNEITVSGPTSMVARSNDTWLTTKVKSRLIGSKNVRANRIKVVTENGVVYLMGLVTRDEADAAVRVARKTYGVQKIVKVFEYIN
ncbi:MAG: BON domain-containing protein [Gammaproteobacteria bacterium]|nr:BON domain-containing protein [Gammaproteobacteria bacterium]